VAYDLNTNTQSHLVFWYLRGLDVIPEFDLSRKFPYYQEWQWPDERGETGIQAPQPVSIVYCAGMNFYTSSVRNWMINAAAPIDVRDFASNRSVGTHLVSIAGYRFRLYLLDHNEHRIHSIRLKPELRQGESFSLPSTVSTTPTTRLAVWAHEERLRVLLWDPEKRGFECLVQDKSSSALHRRTSSLCWPGEDPERIQIGDALVDSPSIEVGPGRGGEELAHEYLYATDLRRGSVNALDLTEFERTGEGERHTSSLVSGGAGRIRFGAPEEASLVAPTSIAVFRFAPEQHTAIKRAFGDADGPEIVGQRFLVCVDSGGKCVVTMGLRPKHRLLLPLIGSTEQVGRDPMNLTTEPAPFDTVVRGQHGALLFGAAGRNRWRALRPWIPIDADVQAALGGAHS
jgi:hypothetical protein